MKFYTYIGKVKYHLLLKYGLGKTFLSESWRILDENRFYNNYSIVIFKIGDINLPTHAL